jgi:acyl-CoA thioesterase I
VIVCIGDSITAGQHLDPKDSPWPKLLLLRDYEVVSFGVPGDTTRLGLERFPRDVQALVPDIVIIQFGHNDCNRWQTDRGLPRVSPKAFSSNLEEMVDRCHMFGARPFLCSLTPSRRSEEHARDVERYDRLVRYVVTSTGTSLIDVRSTFSDACLMEDGLHLTAAGHRAYATAVEAALEREGLD